MNKNHKDEITKSSKILSLHLKSVCDDKGIEKDPVKSAEIIHKLGLLYFQQSIDKITLIQSVGLLNSAIARNPKHISMIKQDLSKVCQFVLGKAKAQNLTADLIEKSNRIKHKIELMRNQTNRSLVFLKTIQRLEKKNNARAKSQQKTKIKFMKKLQLQITKNYTKIMNDLSQYCEHVMGPPPCKFAVVGMGSLARKEITPYSDFEHIILLENTSCDKNCMEYFRWFSVIFHVVVLNLQETIIPSLNIEFLNDKTSELGDWFFDTSTSGISFDGMMVHACKFPLGRTQPTKNKPWTTELIKPVDKMLQYLSDEISLKNGYHLSDLLTETCFVYGDQTLHDAFETGLELYKAFKTRDELLDQIKEQVKDDLDNFATRTKLVNLKPNNNLNVKQMFYRTSTLFISAWGKICETKSSSCFDIIDELAEQRQITEHTKHKLSYAVAIACEIRLNVYMNAQSQRDYIQAKKNAQTIFDGILTTIDSESIVSYFQIAYCLQREIIKELGIKGSQIYSHYTLMNITLCYALRLDGLLLTLIEENPLCYDETDSDLDEWEEFGVEEDDFDIHLENMENELKKFASNITNNPPDVASIFCCLSTAAFYEYNRNLEDKTEIAMRAVNIVECSSLSEEDCKKVYEHVGMNFDSYVGYVNMNIAEKLIAMNKFNEASVRINQALKSFDEKKNEPEIVADFYFMAGSNWFALKEFEKSLSCLKVTLGICLSVDLDQFNWIDNNHVAMMYAGIGICLLNLDQCKRSLIYLKISIQTMKDFVSKVYCAAFFNLALTYYSIGKCFLQLGEIEEALLWFFQALKITESDNTNEETDDILTQPTKQAFLEKQRLNTRANIFYDFGLLRLKYSSYEEAITYFQESFNIYKIVYDANGVNTTRVKLLKCCMEIYQRERVE